MSGGAGGSVMGGGVGAGAGGGGGGLRAHRRRHPRSVTRPGEARAGTGWADGLAARVLAGLSESAAAASRGQSGAGPRGRAWPPAGGRGMKKRGAAAHGVLELEKLHKGMRRMLGEQGGRWAGRAGHAGGGSSTGQGAPHALGIKSQQGSARGARLISCQQRGANQSRTSEGP